MIPRGAKKLTPVMRQYREAKEAFPDAILFFRLGDFYEMFHDDAVVAAGELGLTLTSRNKGAPDEVPMAGVPHHAAPGYVARLIATGHKVAICEQLGDPSKIKGIVPRKVVRVVTPGLLTDADQLDARQNNYLAAVEGDGQDDRVGLALLDVSTGELAAASLASPTLLLTELARAEPRETLLPEPLASLADALAQAAPRTCVRTDPALDDEAIRELLDGATQVPLYEDASRNLDRAAVRAAARVLRFARNHLPDTELPVRRIARHDPSGCLRIDETAQRHLELVRGADGTHHGSVLEVIDETVTAGGARLLRRQLLSPSLDVAQIRRRLDTVELFVAHPRSRGELRSALRHIGDLGRLAIRAGMREASPRDLGVIRDSLLALPAAKQTIVDMFQTVVDGAPAEPPSSEPPSAPEVLRIHVDLLPELATLLERALVDQPPPHAREGGMLRRGYDDALDELGTIRKDGTELLAELETKLRHQTGIGSLKVKYNRVFGWYLEVTRAHLDKVPEPWRRKQTLATAERFTNDELEELADRVLHAEERYAEREAELFAALVDRVSEQNEALHRLAGAVAQWDVSSALAELAHRDDYAKPLVDDGNLLELADARHPVVERYVADNRFVPNDTRLDLEGERFLLITGPNMAGKSTLMRQVALNTILAQMGSFVAAKSARVGIVDRVLSRVGASDNLVQGESTFMVEMRETAAILRDATQRSLVILDEIGRGTSTFDGLAIAWAVGEYLAERARCRVLFATHYHELTELADHYPGVANYSVSAREHDGRIVFLHRVVPGSVSRSYGVAVARLAGLPEQVLARASAVLRSLETQGAPTPRRPSGEGGGAAAASQLSLFDRSSTPPEVHPACETLRHADLNRMTPLEALELLAKLQQMVEPDEER